MKKLILPALVLPALLLSGCAMLTAWKTIPPPGGCDQCHTVSISNNWQVTYQAPTLTDERNREAFQTAQTTMPRDSRPTSSLDLRKVEDTHCFECHKAPNAKHMERTGRYHH